jgi:short-subunit dehydrogenase
MSAENKTALITGATSGIGYELAKIFAENGYHLFLVARSEDELQQTAEELKQQFNVSVETIPADLFRRESAFEIYDQLQSRNVEINVLVNDAGQGQYGEFIETDINREIDIIQLNIISLVALTKQFLKDMVARGEGRILNLASIASKLPGPLQAVYHGTKAFVHSFTEAIREEVKDKGVVITSLLPGATDTDFFNKADMLDSKIVQETKLSDPAKVARDGYDALMNNDDMVVSGMKNKMQVAMGNVMPDATVSKMMHKQQEPVNKEEE